MSDQYDGQNNLNDAFMTESEPSSPLLENKSSSSSSTTSNERRTRLLADIPVTSETQREHRSKFLNDPSTPEEHNLTMRHLVASQSGDTQTVRELRHQILVRRTVRHPPSDDVLGLDVAPLREHAWIDSLADDGVEVAPDFYDRLQESIAPTHPTVIDLGDDIDFIASDMANQGSRRNESSSHARVTEDANDTTTVNVGTSVPLYEQVTGESSHVAENRIDNSNILNEEDDGLV